MNNLEFDPYAPISMGTTLVALKYDGGVIIGSDTRTTSGNFISDRFALKVNQISPSISDFGNIFVERCGNAAHSQMITRNVYNYLHYHAMELPIGSKIQLKTVTNLFKNICYQNKDYLSCAFILSNGKELSSVNTSGAYFNHEVWTSHGSGSAFLDGYMRTKAKRNLTKIQAENIVARAVALAIAADTSSGGCVRIVDVKVDGSSTHRYIDNRFLESLVETEN